MNWTTWILLRTFFMAHISVLDKRLMNNYSVHPLVAAASFGVVGLPVAIGGLLFVAPIPPTEAIQSIGSGGLFIIAAWLYYRVVSEEDISRIVPLLRLTSLQTAILGTVFLGERLTRQQQWAFVVIMVGSFLLSLKPNKQGLTFSRRALQLFPVTTLLAINRILTAHVYRSTSLWAGLAWEQLGMVGGTVLLILVWSWSRSHTWVGSKLRTLPLRIWGLLVMEQVARLLADLVSSWIIVQGVPVSLVTVLSGLRPAWTWLLAIVWIHEPYSAKESLLKGSGILIMSLGLYMLA